MSNPEARMRGRPEIATTEGSNDADGEVIDLTTEANQTWLDEPATWTPYRLLEDEEAKEEREEKLDEIYREVVGEDPDDV